MKQNKELLLSYGIILLPFLVSLFLYPYLPASVQVHFNLQQEANGSLDKNLFVFGMPLLVLLLQSLLYFSSKVKEIPNPNLQKMERFLLPVLFAILYLSLILKNLNPSFPLLKGVAISLGLVFLLIGNYLPKKLETGKKAAPRWMAYGFLFFGCLTLLISLFMQ